jgi:hypothetical protein
MASAQIAEAQRRALEWRPKYGPPVGTVASIPLLASARFAPVFAAYHLHCAASFAGMAAVRCSMADHQEMHPAIRSPRLVSKFQEGTSAFLISEGAAAVRELADMLQRFDEGHDAVLPAGLFV